MLRAKAVSRLRKVLRGEKQKVGRETETGEKARARSKGRRAGDEKRNRQAFPRIFAMFQEVRARLRLPDAGR